MFDFLLVRPFEDRKIDRYETDGLLVSTISVNDSDHPFETAVKHSNYNDGELVIVQEYDTMEEARKGHNKWVKKMTAKKLPSKLLDVSTSGMAKLRNAVCR